MLDHSAKIIAASLLSLGVTISTADAECQTRDTVLGAGAGGIAGDVLSHGSPVGIIAGAVGGGLIGNSISKSDCRSHVGILFNADTVAFAFSDGYWDRDHHWHAWRNRTEARQYQTQHPEHYAAYRHDHDKKDPNKGWSDVRWWDHQKS